MAIKEIPTNVKTYYHLMLDKTTKRLDDNKKDKDDITLHLKKVHEELISDIEKFKTVYGINLNNFPEFVENRYIDGKFVRATKGYFTNKQNDYELVGDLFWLYEYAEYQKKLYDIEKDIELCNKLLNLSLKQYTEILRTYYTEVHKKIILEGNGYVLGNNIGWICVNRCLITSRKRKIDYAATKKKEQELKKQGKRIYNKEEADWCKRNGIEYKAEDKRVYQDIEYCYEIPLLGCTLPNGNKLKLEIADYRHSSCRGKTNEQLIAQCENNTTNICNLPIDLKTKVTLCDKADKILYTKFIRNENQKSVTFRKVNSKD